MTKYEEYKNKISDIQYIFLSDKLDLIDCQYVLTLIYESIYVISEDLIFELKNVFSKINLGDNLSENEDITNEETYLRLFWEIKRDMNNYNTILDKTKIKIENILTKLNATMMETEEQLIQNDVNVNTDNIPFSNNSECTENCISCKNPCHITTFNTNSLNDESNNTSSLASNCTLPVKEQNIVEQQSNSLNYIINQSKLLKTKILNHHYLKDYLLYNNSIKNECAVCGLTEWQNTLLPMKLDFIDGNIYNQDLTNIRLLCPNCFSQIGHDYVK